MQTAHDILNEIFGYDAFRGSQEAVIETLVAGQDALVLMPTGAGKGQTIGAIARGAAGKGRRVLVLAHRAELIDQLTATVRAWGLEPGVIAPGHQEQGYPDIDLGRTGHPCVRSLDLGLTYDFRACAETIILKR